MSCSSSGLRGTASACQNHSPGVIGTSHSAGDQRRKLHALVPSALRRPSTAWLPLSAADGLVVGGISRSAAVVGSPWYGSGDHSVCRATPFSLPTHRTSTSWKTTACGCSVRTMRIQSV